VKQVLTWLAKGVLAVLPAAATVYAVYWLFMLLEGLLTPLLLPLVGDRYYLPGMGLLLALTTLIGVGVLIDIYVGRIVVETMERIVSRIPLVNSIYAAVRDLLHFALPGDEADTATRRVVAWECRPGAWMVGFVTGPAFAPVGEPDEQRVSVYFPMSYQIGGYSLLLRENDLRPLDISVEDAMKAVVTAGVLGSAAPPDGAAGWRAKPSRRV
jgi:uncharacterized membrane protein